jgi:prepilin-type processing-associated H-X9-DG protein
LNNQKQIGLALNNYHAARKRLPPAADSKEYPANPSLPYTFYRWSALAHLLPYMENKSVHDLLDLTVPLYTASANDSFADQNKVGIAQMLPEFLCPSDLGQKIKPSMGPTNYVVCSGSGAVGGTPFDTDGLFFVNSATKLSKVSDGTSHTVAASESLLGMDTQRNSGGAFFGFSPERSYKFVLSFGLPNLTDVACEGSQNYNSSASSGNDPRGFAWCSGEYRCATYNHYYGPNAVLYDCIASATTDPTPGSKPILYSAWGWRAARSLHRGGVNVLFADGSARFMEETVDLKVWRSISTRAGSE